MEEKLSEILLNQKHYMLLFGIVAVIYALKNIKPIADFLFSDQWKWMIAPLNIAMAFIGIFLLKLTDVQQNNLKAMVALIIATFATAAWEWIIKYIVDFIQSKFPTKPSTPTNPPTP